MSALEYPISTLVVASMELLGVEEYVAAGALYGQAGPLTLDEATALVDGWLSTEMDPDPNNPNSPSPGPAELIVNKDVANGYAGLDSSGLLKVSELPLSVVSVSAANTFTKTQTFAAPASGGRGFGPVSATHTDSSGNPLVEFSQLDGNGGGRYAGQIALFGENGLGPNGAAWYMAIDIAATTPDRDFALGKFTGGSGESDPDGIYISNGGTGPATIGLGQSQPGDFASGAYRVKIKGDSASHQGSLQLLANAAQTGYVLDVRNPANAEAAYIDLNGVLWASSLGAGGGFTGVGGYTCDLFTASGTDSTMRLTTGAHNGNLELRSLDASAACKIRTTNASTLTLGTNSTDALTVDASQNVKISKTGATAVTLTLANSAQSGILTLAASGALQIGNTGGGSAIISVGNSAVSWNSLGFFGKAAVAQPTAAGTSTGFTAGSGTGMTSTSTSTGGSGSSAYTFGDIVLALKNLGLVAA